MAAAALLSPRQRSGYEKDTYRLPTYVTSASTFAELRAEYEDTASYDVAADTDLCRRFIVACRLLLVRLQSRSKHGDAEVEMDPELISSQLDDAKAWLAGNDSTASTGGTPGLVRQLKVEGFR